MPGAGTGQITASGTMYYIELDVANLAKWFMGTLGAPDSGGAAYGVGGYSVYFSDRRGNAARHQGVSAHQDVVTRLQRFRQSGERQRLPKWSLGFGRRP